jgi:hypothetical protein
MKAERRENQNRLGDMIRNPGASLTRTANQFFVSNPCLLTSDS